MFTVLGGERERERERAKNKRERERKREREHISANQATSRSVTAFILCFLFTFISFIIQYECYDVLVLLIFFYSAQNKVKNFQVMFTKNLEWINWFYINLHGEICFELCQF